MDMTGRVLRPDRSIRLRPRNRQECCLSLSEGSGTENYAKGTRHNFFGTEIHQILQGAKEESQELSSRLITTIRFVKFDCRFN